MRVMRVTAAVLLLATGVTLGAALVVAAPARAGSAELHQLAVTGGSAYDESGSTVAVADNGATVVVGSPGDTVGGQTEQGSVTVFTRSGATWSQQTVVKADGAAGDRFGESVAFDGTVLVVGAPGDDVAGRADEGSVTVFRRTLGTWQAVQTLTRSSGVAGDDFGEAVAIASRRIYVGARGYDGFNVTTISNVGAVVVFTEATASSWSWAQEALLTRSAGGSGDQFGMSLAAHSGGVIAGAPLDDAQRGCVTAFTVSGSTWTERQTLAGGATGDRFGAAIAVGSGGAGLLVGAPGDDVDADADEGTANAYLYSSSTYTLDSVLRRGGGAAGDQFGTVVAVWGTGETLFAGSPHGYRDGDGFARGGVSRFDRTGSRFEQAPTPSLVGPGGTLYADSIAVMWSGGVDQVLVVGEPHATIGAQPNQGRARVVALGVPGAPTNVAATGAASTQSAVSWDAPADAGDAAIDGYRVTSSGGQVCDAAASARTCTVTGLTNGTSYTFSVTAANFHGRSEASTASAAAVPSAVPDAPTGVQATSAANGQSVVSWTAPAQTGGAALGTYTATSSGGQLCTATHPATSCTVSGLANGTGYTFTVTAANVSGTGTASAPSAPATPSTVPGAPTGVTGTAGEDGRSVVSWTAPAQTGGAAITAYTVTATPGGRQCTWTGGPLACTVTGLANGTAHTFAVTATNASGTGAASAASGAVTPVAAPVASGGAGTGAGGAGAPAATTERGAPAAPARVAWPKPAKGAPVRATFTAEAGTTYAIRATLGARQVTGRCTTVKGQAACTIALKARGRWTVTITPTRGGVTGTPVTRTVRV